ncbi:MAG: EAL domain-containing protein [Silicimonas sp.]|nr:EAL domain-containing protein [Silicimonas sp.]
MLLEDVISNFPFVTTDAVAIGYRPSKSVDWEIVWVNDAYCEMFKAERLDVLGRHPNYMHHRDYIADFLEHVREMQADNRLHLSIGSRCMCDNGDEFWASVSLFVICDPVGEGRHCVLNIRDINDLKDREQAAELALIENEHLLSKVEAAQTRLISALETTPDPFAIFDARDKLVIWNPAFATAISPDPNLLKKGMKLEAVLRLASDSGKFPDAEGRVDAWLRETLSAWETNSGPEYRITTDTNDYKVVLTQAANGDRVVLMIDISDLLEQQRKLEQYAAKLETSNQEYSHQALHDELTGLGNRRFLSLKLEELTEQRKKQGGEIAALHVDLDRFKQVNDTMGHAAGDFVLEEVSRALRNALRGEDVVARTGGDEFVVLMPCSAESDVPERVAARLIKDLEMPVYFEGRHCNFGASVGIARTPLIEPGELLTSSDIALYKAKTAGRGCVAVFDDEDLKELHSSRSLVDEIGEALVRGEFMPVFQPEVDSFSGAVVALEVMARWNHPTRGVLMPADFMDTAEEAQLMARIDALILGAAVAEVRAHLRGARVWPNLSFNVSRARLHDASLLRDLADVSYEGGLTFEIPEAVMLDEGSVGYHRNLEGLRRAGVALAVDDFGSGSASILALRRLSPQRIKIDQRLIEPIVESSSARQLVESMVRTARTLGIGVTGEGVETAEQALVLKSMGCDRLQGYKFAHPMPIEKALPVMPDGRVRRSA